MGQANIFINFSRIFSIHEDVSHEVVMDRSGATTESLLSDGASLLSISAAIEQHHLLESIFHLLKKSSVSIRDSCSFYVPGVRIL